MHLRRTVELPKGLVILIEMALPMLYAEPKIRNSCISPGTWCCTSGGMAALREQRYAVCKTVSCYEVLHHVDLGSSAVFVSDLKIQLPLAVYVGMVHIIF